MLDRLEKLLEWGGTRRDVALLSVSGFALLLSMLDIEPLPFGAVSYTHLTPRRRPSIVGRIPMVGNAVFLSCVGDVKLVQAWAGASSSFFTWVLRKKKP